MSRPASQYITLIPNGVTRTLVCIDAAGEDYCGTLYNPYWPQPLPFRGILELLLHMEAFFDGIGYPQAAFESRSFFLERPATAAQAPVRRFGDELLGQARGAAGTFLLEVRHRGYASWQGVLEAQGAAPQAFSSVRELLLLLEAHFAADAPKPGWQCDVIF